MPTFEMRFLALVAFLLYGFATAVQHQDSVDVLAWPLGTAEPHVLATVSYDSTNATVKSYHPLALSRADEVIRVGFDHGSGGWSGIATSASSLAADKDKTILLHLNQAGQLYHVGFKASSEATGMSGKKPTAKKDSLNVVVTKTQPGQAPHLSKPVVVNEHGDVEGKVEEKSFLQKYWWVFVGFLVLQVLMGSGGKE